MDCLFDVFDLAFHVVLDLLGICVDFFVDIMLFLEGLRYAGLILFEEALD